MPCFARRAQRGWQRHVLVERPREARDAFGHALGRHARERQAKRVAAALDQEVGSGDEGDALALGGGSSSFGESTSSLSVSQRK